MWNSLLDVLSSRGFPARWYCGPAWQQEPWWGWLHIASDLAVWGAYVAIPVVILYFIRHRRDIPFTAVFWLFGAFIFACGTGHLVEAAMFWWPAYRLSALVKLGTAIFSWTTVLALVRVTPLALTLRSPRVLEREIDQRTRQLQDMADRLQSEVLERGRIAADLRASEEQLRLALHAGRMGTWDWNLVTNEVQLDSAEQELTGFNPSSGRIAIQEFFDRVHPDDQPALQSAIKTAHRGEATYDHEFRFMLPDGSLRWIAGRGQVLANPEGEPVRMVGINFDITRRKQDEEALRLRTRAVEVATNGIIIADARQPDLPIVFVNPALLALTGYTLDEILGRNFRFLQGAGTDPHALRELHEALHARSEYTVTLLNYRKDGTAFWNELQLAPITDDRGDVTHMVGILNDVTRRVEVEQAQRQARESAEEANRAKTRFLASMSHEIRTPLAAVLGCADLLFRQVDGEARELAKVIRDQGHLLLRLLNELLDLSKIEAGKLELHIQPVELRSLVDDVSALLQPLVNERQISIHTRVDHSVPAEVPLDPLRFRQVLLNLSTNAIKFTPAGQIELEFRYEASADELPRLVVAVRDTGVGIPAERLPHLFEEFYSSTAPVGPRREGTGLGLSIVRKLIELHGGTIDVDSTVNVGTTFTISLPLTPSQNGHPAGERNGSPPILTEQHPLTPELQRVLVAEDTRSLQYLLRRMLEKLVAEVVVVTNGAEAVESVRTAQMQGQPFDLILMDMQMPVTNGFEATAQIRELGYDGPIVALTAAAMAGERERCLAAGCSDYLSKPIDRDHLWRTLRRHHAPAAGRSIRSG